MEAGPTVIEKLSDSAVVGGIGVAMGSGGTLYLGLTSAQWSAVGVLGGLVVAVLGLLIKTAVDVYFRKQHLKLAQSRAVVLAEMGENE